MATYEYPDYYESFHCIGGICKDSCCAGWEVDVDDDSAELYSNVPAALPMGARFRKELYKDAEGFKFHLTHDKRCPFLNRADNLCDIISEMGEGALCVTCTEYPRYFCDGPEYEQVDLTLSCPEAVRIFYSSEEPLTYVQYEEPLHDTDWEEDPFDEEDDFSDGTEEDWDDAEEELDDEEDVVDDGYSQDTVLSAEHFTDADRERLRRTLDLRNNAIRLLQDRSKSLKERFLDVEALYPEVSIGSDRELMDLLLQMEDVNPNWTSIKARLNEDPKRAASCVGPFLEAGGSALENRMERFATYLVYRYTFDLYYHEDEKRVIRFVKRCYRMLMLILGDWCAEHQTLDMPVGDLEDCTRIFSRQVEHSKGNMDLLIKE